MFIKCKMYQNANFFVSLVMYCLRSFNPFWEISNFHAPQVLIWVIFPTILNRASQANLFKANIASCVQNVKSGLLITIYTEIINMYVFRFWCSTKLQDTQDFRKNVCKLLFNFLVKLVLNERVFVYLQVHPFQQ